MSINGKRRGIALCGLAAALLAGIVGIAANLTAQERTDATSLEIEVVGFADTTGNATIMLMDSEAAYKIVDMRKERREWKKFCRDLADLPITKSEGVARVKHRIDNLKPGEYAVLMWHDRNKNGKVDSNFIGIPQEPIGMSNNFRPKLFPLPEAPSWSKLKFAVRPGENRIQITVQN